MQKKLIFLMLAILLTLVANASDGEFTKAFKICAPYTEHGEVQTEGVNVSSKKQILGWNDNRCIYKESISFSGINSNVVCKLSKSQIDEITSVIEAYELVQKYSGEKPNFSNLDEAQKNPVTKVWQKYLNDASVCTITTEQ